MEKEMTKEELDAYHEEYCCVTCALKKGECGTTCCTIEQPPKKLSLRKSFMLFLADFKASLNR